MAITNRRANRSAYRTSGAEQSIRRCFAGVTKRGYITSATQAKPIKTTRKCDYAYRIHLKDRGCLGKRRAFIWYPPLIVSHALHRILLPFISLIPDLGTELCTFSLLHLPKQFIWENESPQKFRASLRTEHIQRMIKEFPDDTVPSENVTTSLDAEATILLITTKRGLKIKTTTKGRRNKISFNEKWFHNEMCQEARTTKTSQ